ncbi:hypothetical protein SLEP1_g56322 [Rubroshorea leprosula]|uniref:DUF7074 domain-containing protein n=1 Tax=Rubroshorea leprosula TaxID=152421 RepID=A0AAV5MLX3_9ROSI|nr:hypothetical protein SLEP1_g56322 [Rubroshorea leprosula]
MKDFDLTTEPLGQNLIKVISNLCFSVFVFSVIAITYQPPDPWLESAPALTKLFTRSENVTFKNDNSILKTGEDLIAAVAPAVSPAAAVNPITETSIVFLDYRTPVNGSKPDECDVAWKFRNKKEKSWRKYRDFRRFRFGIGESCTYKAVHASGWHSGINARRPRNRLGSLPLVAVGLQSSLRQFVMRRSMIQLQAWVQTVIDLPLFSL